MEKNNQTVNKDHYKQLADKGNTDAMVEYSLILCREKNGKPEKPEEVMKYLKMAVDKGNAYGMTYYANFLRAGYNIEKNLTEAERYYKMAIERETVESRKAFAEYNYAEMLYNDCNRKKESIQYYKMAADGGNIDAIEKYAAILYDGIFGVKANKQEAIKYYKMLADSDKRKNTNAKYYYAKLLYERYTDEESRKEAEKYFKIAEKEGSIGAAYFCACVENKPKEYMAKYLFEAFNKENKKYFVRKLKGLMTEKNAIKRKNIDFTIPVNENGDNLIDLFISNDLLTPTNTILINNLKIEELATVKEENRKKLMECLARNGKERYFEKFLNDKNFLKFEGEEEYEFKIKLLKLAFEDCNYGIANILINSIGGIDRLKDDSIPEILTEMRKKVILDLDLFNSLLNRVGNKDEYFEKIDNLYLEGRNGYGQIKLTREFNKNTNPIEVIDSGHAHLKGKNNGETIIGPKLYELRYKDNGIREATYYDKDGNILVKIITDSKNKTNTFDFKGTEYENIESIENEEEKKAILQNFRNKVDDTIASDFVDIDGFDCTLTNLEFVPIALEDKVNKKLNPTIFKDFNDREEIAEMIVKSIDNSEQEYILGISNDNHRTVMVVSNGKAMLVNTSGKPIDNSDYFTKDIQKIAREKYKESHEELNEKELKEKIKIREVSLTGQVTGNCSLVGNVKTAKLLEQFKGDCKEFIDSGIKIAKLQKNGKELSDIIDVNNKNELEDIKDALEKFSNVAKGLTDEKSKNLQLVNDSEGLDRVMKKISEFEKGFDGVNEVGK